MLVTSRVRGSSNIGFSLTRNDPNVCAVRATQRRQSRHRVILASTDRSSELDTAESSAGEDQDVYAPIACLATCGFVETAYLATLSLTGQSDQVACPLSAASCATVLTSAYAYLFDTIPLSLLGSGAYGAVAVLSLRGMFQKDAGPGDGNMLVYLSTLLVGTSTYLAGLLLTKFSETPCVWCMTSIALSFGIGGMVFAGLDTRKREGLLTPLSGVFAATVLLLNLTLGSPDTADARDITKLEYQNPVVTTVSSEKALAVVKRLNGVGAKMYGAFWCSHCFEQKETLGAEAMRVGEFYVECFPDGWERGKQMAGVCLEPLNGDGKKLEGFPTWVIGGQVVEGDKSVSELEKILDDVESTLP